jgi:hypothetical protein
MEKTFSLENRKQVEEYLASKNIQFKAYEHPPAKTVQDIIGNAFAVYS